MALPYRNAHRRTRTRRPRSARRLPTAPALPLQTGLRSDHPTLRSASAAWQATSVGQLLSGRGEGLSLLHDIGDENDAFGIASLATRMGRFGRYLEAIAFFDHAGRLPLDGKL